MMPISISASASASGRKKMPSNSRLQNDRISPYASGRSWNGKAKKLFRRCQNGGGGGSESRVASMAAPAFSV
jgi:hypothetical protein